MSRIETIKSLVGVTLQNQRSKADPTRTYSMIDALVEGFASETKMSRTDIEKSITGVNINVKEDGSDFTSYRLAAPGHGPIPIPHKCHKKLEWCWPHPEDPDLEICLEIEIPWPCPKTGVFSP